MHLSQAKASAKGHTQTPNTLSLAINRAVRPAMIDGRMTKQFSSVAGANIEKMLVKWKMLWEIMIRQFDFARLLIKHHRLPSSAPRPAQLASGFFLRHHGK